MWILTEDKTMLNTDNITSMDVEESEDDVFIKAYFIGIYTDYYKFCILDNTEDNKNRVQDIFNEIFDSICACRKAFNIPKRLKRV